MTRRVVGRILLVVLAVLLLLAVIHRLLDIEWLWHPLGDCPYHHVEKVRCESYNFWSGISGSNITLPFAAAAFLLGWWHQHNCHIRGCPRLQWHAHPEHGHPVCRKHHPHPAPEAP